MDNISELLIKTALKSNMHHKHGSIIIYRNKILSTGYNYYNLLNGKIYNNNNNNNYELNKYSIHAEKDAISKIKNKNILKYCKIYVIRIKNINELEHGYPCNMCIDLLKKYGLTLKYIKIN